MARTKTASGTVSATASLLPDTQIFPGGKGPNNIVIWSVVGTLVGGATNNATLTFNCQPLGGAFSTNVFTAIKPVTAGAGVEFNYIFPQGWTFPLNEASQFDIVLGAGSAASTRLNITYDLTQDGIATY